jgi:hypothetical protein
MMTVANDVVVAMLLRSACEYTIHSYAHDVKSSI